ncbi:helix-hairpin-helix domain-containing protein [Pseudooceanicola marinus]|uniref:helix-hairpin-helix domain-containing protein n=1 Tax=Pseudooceanicola marinus TaxID=396013 RepID=UPI001CD61CA1|nr:helix-hairpin-helix domain-containing protein [Pseudooceanicola marinus]MCA1335329.1 NADH:ubiquinone oxidoreductase [Pseudooceanicola marinus]
MAMMGSDLCRTTGQALGAALALALLIGLTAPLGFLGALVLAVLVGAGLMVGLQRFVCQGSAGQGPVATAGTQAADAVAAPRGEVQPGLAARKAPEAEGIAAPVAKRAEPAPKEAKAAPAAAKPAAAPDDLQQLKGVGPKLAEALAAAGITRFDQIAAWTEADLAWVDENVKGARGRASRDGWIAQAQELSAANGAG